MTLPICSRSGDIIEQVMKPQWWVDCKPLAKKAVEAVKSQGMVITPETNEREFFRWMDNIQDWCISRQLWWGHRCPAYFVEIEGKEQDVSRSLVERQLRAALPTSRFSILILIFDFHLLILFFSFIYSFSFHSAFRYFSMGRGSYS